MAEPMDLLALPSALRHRTVVAYGIGDAGTGMAAALIGFYLFVFYTQIAGLPPWLAGLVLMVGRLWDAINDQLMGWLSDRTRSRLGPRVPWMIWSALPLGLSMALMWWFPPGGELLRFGWFVLSSVVFMAAYTGVNLPYCALATELTEDTKLRTRLNAARFTGSILSSLVGLLLGALLVGYGAPGYLAMGAAAGAVAVVGTLLSAWGLAPAARVCRRPSGRPEPITAQLGRIRRNGRFLRVVGLYLLLWGALQLMQPVSLLYLSEVMHLPQSWSTWMLIPFQLSAMAGLELWSRLAARRGRLVALRWGGGLWIAMGVLAMLLVPLDATAAPLAPGGNSLRFALLVLVVLLLGLGAATAYLLPWSLLPDAIDADPERPAGLFTAWMVMTQKLGSALSVFLLGNLLSWSGYVAGLAEDQPATAVAMIRLCIGLIPAVLVTLGLVVMRRWPQQPVVSQQASA
ncbi:MFS transporter [Synechococcus sp. CS-602]|uniref:MFS transporter n=1 Tax=Synechococcaceae TaxID=1890426 RepID=UPI0008FF6699|nr:MULTISPECIES: MFS transporter [Synechococcaceae]MCT4365195.1 MFS transporter [Candidatus Regnicoccus frigidus MAG-AL1]APD48034.1 MFS transporter [Synechococcus sp. SynAce01]MCT0203088.1 MFS transporter [Synechococcus sp. CS-603]MCT0204724.1 MFS transporter [Synechococcus sp. CS-602]MCT0246146.1 MFS transporter [Synechococcus sp. CS-601]